MACDMVVAADDATFGQPEIKIGIMPGAGGTQRLTRALGKAKAMELILTGRNLSALEAYERGLVSQIVAREETLPAALALAAEIASMPPLAVRAAKEAVNRAHELSLEAGPGVRAAQLLHALRIRGPEGRHGRLHRQAQADLEGPLTEPVPGLWVLVIPGFPLAQ